MKKEKSYFHAACINSIALKVVVLHPVSCVMKLFSILIVAVFLI